MQHISEFNKDTDEFLANGQYIHRELCIRTRAFWGKERVRFYHYLYEVIDNGALYPVVEAISDREYGIALRVLSSNLRKSPYNDYIHTFGV